MKVNLSTASAQTAQGNLRQILDKASPEAIVENANVVRDKELVRLCNVANYAETLILGAERSDKNGKFCAPLCGEVDRRTNSGGRCILRRIRRWKQNWASQRNMFFDTERCSGFDVIVPSTENPPEKFVWVSACTNEVQNCRQIAAINTIILRENPDNEAPASSGQLAARNATVKAKKDLEQEFQPLKIRAWSVVPCSREVPDDVFSGQGIQENVKMTEHCYGKNKPGLYQHRGPEPNKRTETVSDLWQNPPGRRRKNDAKFAGQKGQR